MLGDVERDKGTVREWRFQSSEFRGRPIWGKDQLKGGVGFYDWYNGYYERGKIPVSLLLCAASNMRIRELCSWY